MICAPLGAPGGEISRHSSRVPLARSNRKMRAGSREPCSPDERANVQEAAVVAEAQQDVRQLASLHGARLSSGDGIEHQSPESLCDDDVRAVRGNGIAAP